MSVCRLGYEGLFCRRVGDSFPEGAATFYKSSQFKLSQHEHISYTQLAHNVSDTAHVGSCYMMSVFQ